MFGIKLIVVFVNYKMEIVRNHTVYLQPTNELQHVKLKSIIKKNRKFIKHLKESNRVTDFIDNDGSKKYNIYFQRDQMFYERKWAHEEFFNYLFSNLYYTIDLNDDRNIGIIKYDETFLKRKEPSCKLEMTIELNIHMNISIQDVIKNSM